MGEELDRLPPHSIEAERCALGAMMLAGDDRAAFAETRALLSKSSFYLGDHAIIFDAICGLHDRTGVVDAVLLRDELRRLNVYADVGGDGHLATIVDSVPNAAHGPHYARIVAEKAALRGCIAASERAINRCYAAAREDRSSEIIQSEMDALARLSAGASAGQIAHIGDVLTDVVAQVAQEGGVPTLKTGFRDFDEQTGGIGFGEMCIVAARPSMGKSTLLKQIALKAAESVPVGIISLEEGRFKIGRNLLAAEAGVENNQLRRSTLGKEQWDAVNKGVARMKGLPLYVCDRARRLADVRAVAAMLVARHGVKLILIDYLQRITVEGASQYEKASIASLAVSDMFKELEVAGLVAAQLNRGVEQRDDKRPGMADLRDSGQIEQDADGIVFLHREDYYHLDDGNYQPTHEAELILAKWRDGVRGTVITLKSELRYQRFADKEQADPWKPAAMFKGKQAGGGPGYISPTDDPFAPDEWRAA